MVAPHPQLRLLGSRPRRKRGLLPTSLALLALASCARDGGHYACSCEYVTDYDDGYRVQVDICAATAERAPGLAKDCAQPGAPAPIQRCSCAAVVDAPCKEGVCVRK